MNRYCCKEINHWCWSLLALRIQNSDKRDLSVFSNYFCVTSGTWSISLRSTWRRTTCVTGCEWYPQRRTRMSCGTSKSIMRTKMRREKMNLNLVHICNSELKSWIKEALRSSIFLPLSWYSNSQNHEHQKYLWNVIVLEEKSQSGMRNQTTSKNVWSNELVCGLGAINVLRVSWSLLWSVKTQ